MAKYKRPGVFVRQVTTPPALPSVSPSALGMVGFTRKGQANEAIRIESFDDFNDIFGGYTNLSLVPLELEKFFNNGGQIAYIVRVTPVGSTIANGYFNGSAVSTIAAKGDGLAQRFQGTLPNAPITEKSLTFTSTDGVNTLVATDVEGLGTLEGTYVDVGGANYINYVTGEYDFTYTSAPTGSAVTNLTNDELGAYNNPITDTVSDPGFIPTGMGGGTATTNAIGTITTVAGALIGDTETFTLNDGVNPALTFQFVKILPLVPGNIQVTITNVMTAAEVSRAIRDAINGVGTTLNITAEVNGASVTAAYTRSRWEFYTNSEGDYGNNVRVELQGNETTRRQIRSGDTAPYLATGNGTAGPYTFTIPNSPLVPNSITITAGTQVAYDNGSGTLVGDIGGGSTVNYTNGAVSVTFAGAVPLGYIIRVSQNGFETFDTLISEFQLDTEEYLVQEVFDDLSLTDTAASNYMPTVINDDGTGSNWILVRAGQIGVLPTMIRTTYKQTIGVGDGVNRRFTGTLANLPVDKFSVKAMSVLPYQEGVDDGVGFITGDNMDPFGVNQIVYSDGTVDVTFKVPPTTGQNVDIVYTKLQTADHVDLSGGSDGTGIISSNQIANPSLEADKKGVYAFNLVEQALHIIVPDFAENAEVLRQLISYAEAKKNRFIIGTTAKNLTPSEAVNFRRSEIRSDSSLAAVYYPWIKTLDRSTNRVRTIPPLGHVAGVYSRVDRTRSEGKAPAGISDGRLEDLVGLERILENEDVETVFPVNINSIVQSAAGTYVNGARTLSSDPDFKYVSVSRVFIAYRMRAENDLKFALFEPIGPALYSRVAGTLTAIALEYFQKGALAGSNPREAFIVTVDELNTPELAEQGIVRARVALAPTKPAEFIEVELAVKQREGTITTVGVV